MWPLPPPSPVGREPERERHINYLIILFFITNMGIPAPSLRLGSPMLITSEYVLAGGEATLPSSIALAVTAASLAIGCQHGVLITSFR